LAILAGIEAAASVTAPDVGEPGVETEAGDETGKRKKKKGV